MRQRHRYGWKPEVGDQRDIAYKRKIRLFLPRKVDLRSICSPVEDQGELGSCTAQALAGNMELLDIKDGNDYEDVSRLFIYYNERKIEGTINEDSGAYIRDGIKSLVKYGVCKEILHPYDIAIWKKEPSTGAYNDALKRRITLYQRLSGVSDMLACLADGYPVVFGLPIYESFESEEVENTGLVPVPEKGEVMLGGHAMMTCGYDMDKKWFIVRNSWGMVWGYMGYCYIPFSYMEQSEDRWVVFKTKGVQDEEVVDVGGNGCFIKRGLQRFIRGHFRPAET